MGQEGFSEQLPPGPLIDGMIYGRLTPEQETALRPHVAGREVFDLGSGSFCGLSMKLVELGAKKVIAVDTRAMYKLVHHKLVQMEETSFEEIQTHIDVAFVSWPENNANYPLLRLIDTARTVVYLGSNSGGNACAWPDFFLALAQRELLAHVPVRKNTLLVYGGRLNKPRALRGEEKAGIGADPDGRMIPYEEVEKYDRESVTEAAHQGAPRRDRSSGLRPPRL